MRSTIWRIALYSPGIVGLGHMRRSLLIGQTLANSRLPVTILWIAESRQAGAFHFGPRMDCVSLPALKKLNGNCEPRYLEVSSSDIIRLRSRTICAALESFEPDVFIVDKLPRGALRELDPALNILRARTKTRCVLGLRDVLDDPEAVHRDWQEAGDEEAIRKYYHKIWVYGDPAVYDPVREYNWPPEIAAKVRFTGYLDQRARLKFSDDQNREFLTEIKPPLEKFAMCLLGGGQDGAFLAEAFAQATFPADMSGIILTGPFMPPDVRKRLHEHACKNPRLRILDFVAEPALLLDRADRVVAMGGYNTVCELLSFAKHTLIVPRVVPRREQLIRATRMRDLGLLEMIHPDDLTPHELSKWLARDLGPVPRVRETIRLDGLANVRRFVNKLLTKPRTRESPMAHPKLSNHAAA
jgi:predicted glycosyltransferase